MFGLLWHCLGWHFVRGFAVDRIWLVLASLGVSLIWCFIDLGPSSGLLTEMFGYGCLMLFVHVAVFRPFSLFTCVADLRCACENWGSVALIKKQEHSKSHSTEPETINPEP